MVFYNRAILSTDNIIHHLVKKFSVYPTQWMHYKTDVSNTVYLHTEEKNNNQNSSFHLNASDVHTKSMKKNLHNFLSQRKKQTIIYLMNDEVAKQFVVLIKDDLLKNMKQVVEINPGLGLLTKELLQANVPFIHLYESNTQYSDSLNNLSEKFPNRLSLKIFNTCSLSKLLSDITVNTDDKLLSNIQKKKWEESCVQIVGATIQSAFIRNLIGCTIFQTSIMMYGRPTFYFAIPMSIYRKLVHPKRSTAIYIIFNTLFNLQIFGTVDRKAFLPQHKSKNTKSSKLRTNEDCLLTVVKIEPKPDLFTLFKSRKDLIYFWHFVRHNFYKPSTKVIPTLEKIIPDCGVKLIAQNYNIFTQFSDLTPTQVYDLFFQLQSWPGFEESTFVLSANDIKNLYDPYLEE
nr:PREDICTED: dimethyladenosine transferase 2, mitochondrial [Megachile rotundata]